MTANDVFGAYSSRAEELVRILGPSVSPTDPDRPVIESWARTVPGPILDVGSGTGRWSGHLAGLGYAVEGLEPVEAFVDVAHRTHPAVEFRPASIADLVGCEERWGGVLAWYSLIHLTADELTEALATLRGVLVDQGSMLISFFAGPRLEAFSHPATTAYRWPIARMDQALEQAGFEVVRRHWNPQTPHANITAKARRREDHDAAEDAR